MWLLRAIARIESVSRVVFRVGIFILSLSLVGGDLLRAARRCLG